MKLISILFVWYAVVGLASRSAAADGADLVDVTARVHTTRSDPKGGDSVVVNKSLEIQLASSEKIAGALRVVATIYGRDVRSRKQVSRKSEKDVMMDDDGRRSLDTPNATFKSVPDHYKRVGKGKQARRVKVEATGEQYAGWSVKVYQGNKLVGQAASGRQFE